MKSLPAKKKYDLSALVEKVVILVAYPIIIIVHV